MKITVLIDNQPHPENHSLEVEHGLCFYIEMEEEKILLDVGASDKFFQNALKLGIDIADVDYLILSHAHKDHTGGLACFLQNNSKAKIYLSTNINDEGYYSNRRGTMRNISIDYSLIQENCERFVWVKKNLQLTPSAQIMSEILVRHPLPQANQTLFAGNKPDTFNHEMAVLLSEQRQTVLLSSCTHLGLLNTLEACKDVHPSVFIGGMHLVDSDEQHPFETVNDQEFLATEILSNYPNLQIYTGHCTGVNAQRILSEKMPKQFHVFYTGFKWDL